MPRSPMGSRRCQGQRKPSKYGTATSSSRRRSSRAATAPSRAWRAHARRSCWTTGRRPGRQWRDARFAQATRTLPVCKFRRLDLVPSERSAGRGADARSPRIARARRALFSDGTGSGLRRAPLSSIWSTTALRVSTALFTLLAVVFRFRGASERLRDRDSWSLSSASAGYGASYSRCRRAAQLVALTAWRSRSTSERQPPQPVEARVCSATCSTRSRPW